MSKNNTAKNDYKENAKAENKTDNCKNAKNSQEKMARPEYSDKTETGKNCR